MTDIYCDGIIADKLMNVTAEMREPHHFKVDMHHSYECKWPFKLASALRPNFKIHSGTVACPENFSICSGM